MITIAEIKEELEGCEVLSLTQAGTVGIVGGEAYMLGSKLKLTAGDWRKLWEEYVYYECVMEM